MSKKVVLFSTYLLEDQTDYLFDKQQKLFRLEFFKSSAMLDYFLSDPKTLETCNDYFAMMDWKKKLKEDDLWLQDFEFPSLGDEICSIIEHYEGNNDVYNQLICYVDNTLGPILNLSADQIDKSSIKLRITDIANDELKQECQRNDIDAINIYWGAKDAPELPLLHRRFSLYMLKNEDCADYATYGVWPLRFDENNNVNEWRDALIDEICEWNPDCKEIILAIHGKDAGYNDIPFKILESKEKYKNTPVCYSVVLFDHANSRIHPLLRRNLSCKQLYEKISTIIEVY